MALRMTHAAVKSRWLLAGLTARCATAAARLAPAGSAYREDTAHHVARPIAEQPGHARAELTWTYPQFQRMEAAEVATPEAFVTDVFEPPAKRAGARILGLQR